MRDLRAPNKFWWCKNCAKLNSLAKYSRAGRRDSLQWVEFGPAGDSGYVAYFFIAVVTILRLASCFIGNYRAQASHTQATHCRPMARSMPSPFAKFPQPTHHNATRCLRFHSLYQFVYTTLKLSTTRKSSSPCPAVLVSIDPPYPRPSIRMIPVTDPLLTSIPLCWRRTFCRLKTFLLLTDVKRKAANNSGCPSSRSMLEVLLLGPSSFSVH